MDAQAAHLLHRLLPDLDEVALELLLDLRHDLLDAGWMDAAVRHEPLERLAGDLPTHRIERGERHDVRCFVNDQVHAGLLLEGADVAPLPPDEAALHVLVGQRHGGGGGLDGEFGRVALHRLDEDALGFLLGVAFRLLLDALDDLPGLLPAVLLEPLQQKPPGLLVAQPRNLLELFLLLRQDLVELAFLGLQCLLALAEASIALDHFLLLAVQQLQLAVEHLVPLVEPLLVLGKLRAPLARLLLELLAHGMLALFQLELRLLGGGVRLLLRVRQQLCGLALGPQQRAAPQEPTQRETDGKRHEHTHDEQDDSGHGSPR